MSETFPSSATDEAAKKSAELYKKEEALIRDQESLGNEIVYNNSFKSEAELLEGGNEDDSELSSAYDNAQRRVDEARDEVAAFYEDNKNDLHEAALIDYAAEKYRKENSLQEHAQELDRIIATEGDDGSSETKWGYREGELGEEARDVRSKIDETREEANAFYEENKNTLHEAALAEDAARSVE